MMWLRWYDGTCADGKFQIVARNAQAHPANVIAIWAIMLEDAAHPDHRGIAMRGVKFYSMILGIPIRDIEIILQDMAELGLVELGSSIVITNWNKRQFETDLNDPTNASRKRRWRSKGRRGTVRERRGTVRERSRNTVVHPDTDTDTDTDTDKNIYPSKNWPEDFREKFWNAYPRKVGKGSAIRKLESIRASGEIEFNILLTAIGKIEASEDRFIPHPTTWLNQGRYLDLLPPPMADPEKNGGWRPGLPTDAELRARYAQRRKDAATARTTADVLAAGMGVSSAEPNGLGLDRGGNRGNGGMDPVFSRTELGTVCDASDTKKATE